jgi:hypothetical protein
MHAHSAVLQGIQQQIYCQCDHITYLKRRNIIFKNGPNNNALVGQFKQSQYAVIMYWAYSLLQQPNCYSTVCNWLILHRLDLGLHFDSKSDLDSENVGSTFERFPC